MIEHKGLTGIDENIRGFVGGKEIVRDKTLGGRSRIFFDLCAGVEKLQDGKFPTWRHIIVYGQAADDLKDIIKGCYVEVVGFVQTVAMRDKAGLIISADGILLKEEHVISEKARHIPKEIYRQGRQLPFGSETLAPVGQTS